LKAPRRLRQKCIFPSGKARKKGHLPARAVANLERLDQIGREERYRLERTCLWVTKIDLMVPPPMGFEDERAFGSGILSLAKDGIASRGPRHGGSRRRKHDRLLGHGNSVS
jgi:hypothetical protein